MVPRAKVFGSVSEMRDCAYSNFSMFNTQSLLDYFNEECDYLEKRKNKGMEIDRKEYNTMNILRDKAFEVGAEILSIDDTNKFGSELANLSC